MAVETVSVAASAAHRLPKPFSAGFVGHRMTTSLATTSLDDVGDIVEIGYLPANVTLWGYIVSSGALDTNGTPLLTAKLTVGATDTVTGITSLRAGTATFFPCAPLTTTAVTKVQINVTAVAATGVAGTVEVLALYQNL
jgi:hypothetical protein